jgi:hypothetical protein
MSDVARQNGGRRSRHSLPRIAGRLLVGRHWHGKPLANGTFWRRGTDGPPHWWGTGTPSRWAKLPGAHRAAVWWAVLLTAVGLLRARELTEWALALVGGPVLGITGWRCYRALRLRHHRREVAYPLAEALSPSLETSADEARRTVHVPLHHDREGAVVTAELPGGWQGHDGQREAATRIVGHRLGGEWVSHVQRSPLALVMRRRPEPPGALTFAEVADLIRDEGGPLRVLAGLGAGREPFWLDFADLIVNLGVSVGTGGGKSSFLRYLVAQLAYWGAADFPVIDSKMVSLAGMEDIPGLRVYDEIPAQWAVIEALAADIDDRYRWLKANPGFEFPLCCPLLEEQNDFSLASRSAWGEIRGSRDPLTPPVYPFLARVVIKGRQVGYRTTGVYQRLTSEACGGMSAPVMRDAYGGKALARHSMQAWDSLTGLRPWVPPSDIPGRWVLVVGSKVTSVQVPRNDAAELVEFVASSPHRLSGPLERPWASALAEPGGDVQPAAVSHPGAAERPGPGGVSADSGRPEAPARPLAAAPRYRTQGEVADALGMATAALVKWRQRCRQAGAPLPEPVYFAGRPGWTDEQVEAMAARRKAGPPRSPAREAAR